MALTERDEVFIEVLPDGSVQERVVTIIERDGEEVARTNHRLVAQPDAPVPARFSARTKAIADTVWTPEVKTSFAEKVARRND